MTNVDNGAVLLPFIERSGAETDYAISMEALLESSVNALSFGEDVAVLLSFKAELRNSGDLQHMIFSNFDLGSDEDLSEVEMAQLAVFQSLEMVGTRQKIYGRGEGFEKWIDITSVVDTGAPVITPLQAFIEDSELAMLLFEQATGEFDPRDVESIEADTGVSPLLDFQQVPSLPDRVVYEHRSNLEQDLGLLSVNQNSRIAFRIDPETERIVHTFNSSQNLVSGFVEGETSSLEQYTIEYEPQDIFMPQPGDPSIETDPDKIAAFLELFD